jgi:hypothetical protein
LAVLGRDSEGQPESSATANDTTSNTGDPAMWELAKQTDPDVAPLSRRLLRSIAHATRWRAEYRTARDALAANSAVAPAHRRRSGRVKGATA